MTDLGEFQGRAITKATIAVRRAGDGLSEAVKVEPQVFTQGDVVYVLMETQVGAIRFRPIGELEEECTTDLVCRAATIIEEAAVPDALARTKALIQRRKEEDAGVQRLPTDEELRGDHFLGFHEDAPAEGCVECGRAGVAE